MDVLQDRRSIMPWRSKTAIELRQEFVALATLPNANIRALCHQFNVSPETAYKLLRRVRTMGSRGYHDLSRRPLHCPRRTSQPVENAVLSIRADHLHWGGRQIAEELRRRGVEHVPA